MSSKKKSKKKSKEKKVSNKPNKKSKEKKLRDKKEEKKEEKKEDQQSPVVRQESFRDKLKRTFNLSKPNVQSQTKPKDTISSSSKGQNSSSGKSGSSSNSSKRTPPKRDSEKVEKAPEKSNTKPRVSKADKTSDKVIATPERVTVTPQKSSKPAPRQGSKKSETRKPLKMNRSEEKKKEEWESSSSSESTGSDTSFSSKSTESISDAFPVGRSSSRLLASKKGKSKEESSSIAEEGLKIASKVSKAESDLEIHSTLNSVISSPSAWMEFRAGQSENSDSSKTESKPIGLPDHID